MTRAADRPLAWRRSRSDHGGERPDTRRSVAWLHLLQGVNGGNLSSGTEFPSPRHSRANCCVSPACNVRRRLISTTAARHAPRQSRRWVLLTRSRADRSADRRDRRLSRCADRRLPSRRSDTAAAPRAATAAMKFCRTPSACCCSRAAHLAAAAASSSESPIRRRCGRSTTAGRGPLHRDVAEARRPAA